MPLHPAPHRGGAIETRKEGFNTIGWTTKAINDQLKSRSPDLQGMTVAAKTIANTTPEINRWFPAGSGRESGAGTDALPAIWKERGDFDALALVLESAPTISEARSNAEGQP